MDDRQAVSRQTGSGCLCSKVVPDPQVAWCCWVYFKGAPIDLVERWKQKEQHT